eukprot:gb/GEZN01001940.1/.p1 GENE.gb/GEZN01001940.1/~~gb/GEZN01001940.1/.p1  ORF type:complete len:601 (-),score=116.78 gb/GEZN01001940.1/:755-2557(-)
MPPKGKHVSKKRQKELDAIAAKKKDREAAKEERQNEKDGVVAVKEEADYRMATGVLESRPRAMDVKIGGFSLNVYGQELIKDTSLEFTIGRRYGLIGANGSGKSSLLKSIAAREVPVPDHIDIFILSHETAPTEMTALETVLANANAKVKHLEDEMTRLLIVASEDDVDELMEDITARLEMLDVKSFEERAGKLLHGLGFSKEMSQKATKDMSGGWRMRVALAEALFVKPTLLLLDEPTNHLDLEACVWLEQYLSTYPRCLVVVSHSQEFLNTACNNIIDITPQGRLEYYTGNYDSYVKTRQENRVNQLKKYKKEQDDIKHLKAFIASCGTYSNLVKQAKSKQKILDKMSAAGLTEKPSDDSIFKFRFNECEQLAGTIIAFNNVAFAYSGLEKDTLYKGLSLGVQLDSRIALVGPNGAGKSTLLKLMCGDITPTIGNVSRHIHLSLGRYHQHSADILDPEKEVLQFFMDSFEDKKLDRQQWRTYIGKYGVSGKMQLKQIKTLSDGQKTRVVFAMIALKTPNLLLLDEPTNHLDIPTIDSLADAIKHFRGGVVLVSHDFRLIDQVAQTVWICDDHTVKEYPGDIRQYKQNLVKRMRRDGIL